MPSSPKLQVLWPTWTPMPTRASWPKSKGHSCTCRMTVHANLHQHWCETMLLPLELENLHLECISSPELQAGPKTTQVLKNNLAILVRKPWLVPSKPRLSSEIQTTGMSKKSMDLLLSNASSGPMNHFAARLSTIPSFPTKPMPTLMTSSTPGKMPGACPWKRSQWGTWRTLKKSDANKVHLPTMSVPKLLKRSVKPSSNKKGQLNEETSSPSRPPPNKRPVPWHELQINDVQ